jgi:DNA-binding PadR family transcriptional regulator
MKRFFESSSSSSPDSATRGFCERAREHFGRHGGGHHRFGGFGQGPDSASPWGGGDPRMGGRGGRMGGGAGRGPGGRGGRMFGQGDLRLVVLELVATTPRHGYDIIKAIEDLFGGQYAPSPGAIYPTLTLLEEQDYLISATTEGSGKKLYTITETGRQHLAENRATVDGVMARMQMAARAMAGDMPPESVAQAMHTLKHALMFRRGSWSDAAEVARVAKILQDAANAIVQAPTAKE